MAFRHESLMLDAFAIFIHKESAIMLRLSTLTAAALAALLSMPALSLASEPAIENTERDQYLGQLRQQHATSSERTALLAQINSLLSQHALLRGYQIGHAEPEDLLYSIQAPGKGTLQVREERRSEAGPLRVSQRTLSLYGMDPFFSYRCESRQVDCSILHDGLDTPLLHIVRNPDAAAELSKALSYLARNIQQR